jgi:hypothetical protein
MILFELSEREFKVLPPTKKVRMILNYQIHITFFFFLDKGINKYKICTA